jgi:hypothetical protein
MYTETGDGLMAETKPDEPGQSDGCFLDGIFEFIDFM